MLRYKIRTSIPIRKHGRNQGDRTRKDKREENKSSVDAHLAEKQNHKEQERTKVKKITSTTEE